MLYAPMFLKRSKILTLIIATFLAISHCTISDIIASFLPSKIKSSHCGHGEENKVPGNHHSSCEDNGCCQPLLKTLEVSSGDAAQTHVSFGWLPVDGYAANYSSPVGLAKLQLPLPNAPPANLHSYISSLQYAPNAPPIRC